MNRNDYSCIDKDSQSRERNIFIIYLRRYVYVNNIFVRIAIQTRYDQIILDLYLHTYVVSILRTLEEFPPLLRHGLEAMAKDTN